ncbi:MAG: hypothetical protein JXQ75_02030 [Phycisphaerae bacterium]|nr:hypothetical protein [Phycisphaerae bacterium]
MTDQAKLLEKLETHSSIFDKTDADFRRRLDQAVIDRDPPTYKAVYNKFKLAASGISFMAFYRYARRLRTHAAMLELAEHTLPDGCRTIDVLPQLLANRLLDAAIDESTSPRTLQRLTDAWRFAVQTQLALDRHQTALDEIRKQAANKDTDRLCKMIHQYAAVTRAQQTATVHPSDPIHDHLQTPHAGHEPDDDRR